jgi:outer membrane cobalamin receptor
VGNLYGGIKGVGNKNVDFEIKYNYAEYSDLPTFINSPSDASKFEIMYIGGVQKIQVANLIGQVNIHVSNAFTSSLKVDQVTYSLLNKAFQASHRPGLTLSWTNTWKLSNKVFISPDVYWMKDLFALNPAQNQLIQLDDIVDLNFKINYFVKRNVNLGLSGNNLLGKTYQRFNQYKNQGRQVNLTLAYSF